jgi:hypothetical protein
MRELNPREISNVRGGAAVAGAVLGGLPSAAVNGADSLQFYNNPFNGAICYQSIYDYRAVMYCIK